MVLFNLVTQFIYKHWFISHWALKMYNNVSEIIVFSVERLVNRRAILKGSVLSR